MSEQIISPERLRAVVLGQDKTLRRVTAMALLATSRPPHAEDVFAQVLANEKEHPRMRAAAAVSLGKLGTPAAEEALIKQSRVSDQRVLADVAKALGRIGGERALAALAQVRQRTTGLVAAQAQFAAALISHRLGLAGNELAAPDGKNLIELPPAGARPVQFAKAEAGEAALSLRTLAFEPIGIEYDQNALYQVRCGRSVRMLAINRAFTAAGAINKLTARKTLLGAVALKSVETDGYSISHYLLTEPGRQPNTATLLVYRTNGTQAFAGTAQVTGARVSFSLRAVNHPGATPVRLEGTFENGQLNMQTALAAPARQPGRQPARTARPSRNRPNLTPNPPTS